MSEKIIGYILLIIGIAIIGFSGFSVYQVFTKKTQPVQLFSFSGISIDMSKMLAQNLPTEIQGIELPPMKQEIITSDMVNKPMNLFTYVVFMGFISTIGLKIATIGTLLIRTIDVHVKESSPLTQPK